MSPRTVLLLGASGRTGGRVLRELLARDVRVRAIVRTVSRVPADALNDPRLATTEASLLSLGGDDLVAHARGCDAVISCLGHVISVRGVLGPPRDLVTRATTRICRAIEEARPETPVRFILMSSVSVNHPSGPEPRRSAGEKAFLGLLRRLVPPPRDNQQAADFLHRGIGPHHRWVCWAVVRPDTLVDGPPCAYALHDHVTGSLFKPGRSSRENVARFMCDLVTDAGTWERWAGRLPVIIDAPHDTPAGVMR